MGEPEDIHALRWYHTIDLPDGSATPGEYDLRPIVQRLPLPASLAGKRCLDVGSRDGFYAFEMERRGAAEVVSLDIGEPSELHFPGAERPAEEAIRAELDDGHRAFEAARAGLGSGVRRELRSVYELTRDDFGAFDFAIVATLLLHLRDPILALSRVRGVLDGGELLINEAVIPGLPSLDPRPRAEMLMRNGPFWWICNPAGLGRLAEAGGLSVTSVGRPYVIPWGAGHRRLSTREALDGPVLGAGRRLMQHRLGALHAAVLTRSPVI